MSRRTLLTFLLPVALAIGVVLVGKTPLPGYMRDGFVALFKPLFGLSIRSQSRDTELESTIKKLSFANQELEAENNRLRNALAFKEKGGGIEKGADVLFEARELGKEFLIINRGSSDGIHEGDGVIDSNEFFVGTIKTVGDKTAKVAVASNNGETASIELVPSGTRALARAIGARTFALDLVEGDAPVHVGDFVALAHSHAASPLLLAEVAYVHREVSSAFQEVNAVLLSHPDQLKEVFIINNAFPE